MKAALSIFLSFVLVCATAPPSEAEPRQLPSGTEMHLTLVTPVNTAIAKAGDPLIAVTNAPVVLNNQTIVPAGTRIHGVIGTVQRAKYFSSFKGQAYLNIVFKTIEIDSRLISAQMSLQAIGKPRVGSGTSPLRKDVKITEGEVVQEKHSYKEDALALAIGGGGGSTIGLIAGSVGKGMGIGFAVGAAYVVAHKGKEVKLPANTAMLVRVDSTVTVPYIAASKESAGATQVASAQ
jgi:hypothetical protein